jgi:uncharacterized protein (UPF0276 family)
MTKEEFLLKQIECDKHNIQQMIDLLPCCETKSSYRNIASTIKETMKDIRNSKLLIDENLFKSPIKNQPKLFEVKPSPVDLEEHYAKMHSFFGDLE